MVEILGISAFSSGTRPERWWEWTLVAVLGASVVVGVFFLLRTSFKFIRVILKRPVEDTALPRAVQERIQLLSQSALHVRPVQAPPSEPASFGVYLGLLSSPITEEEVQVLSQWDAVILDHCEPGVLEAVHGGDVPFAPHIIARLDMLRMLDFGAMEIQSEVDMLKAIHTTAKAVQETLRQPNQARYFTGVLVAEWRERLSVPLLGGLAKLFAAYGFHVFLEIGPPDFLDGSRSFSLNRFAGVVIRNGTVLQNGDRRDFFNMDKMKGTTKAFVSESCMRPFTVMMWDTVEDDAHLSHAVARRAHIWCNYHGAIPFIVRKGALKNTSQARSCDEPLAAFQWLKDRKAMAVHEKFRKTRILSRTFSSIIDDYLPLESAFPLLRTTLAGLDSSESDDENDDSASTSTLTVQYPEIDENGALLPPNPESPTISGLDWNTHMSKHTANPLSCSFSGKLYGSLGCFPVGLNATQEDFDHVLRSQQRLRELNLLNRLPAQQTQNIGGVIGKYAASSSQSLENIPGSRTLLAELANNLTTASDEPDGNHHVQIHIGLDSGFHTPSGCQFWAIWEVDRRTSWPIIYISKSVKDLPAVLLHTYLSKSNFSRYHCFLLEMGLSEHEAETRTVNCLPQRLKEDISLLSPSDLLLLLQHLQYSEWDSGCPLLSSIRQCCEDMLIDVPTYRQLKKMCNIDYLSGSVTADQLVSSRLRWYRLCQLPCLAKSDAIRLFRQIDSNFKNILWSRDHQKLEIITSALEKLIGRRDIDSVCDFILFCIFCAARKAGFEEVYIEVSDRNPLFNQYTDQSAAFAELFALGSRCEAYFDITPSDMGVLLSKRHRDYYNQTDHQPPMWIFNAPSFASAYAAAQTDIDPEQRASVMPGYRRFTFLSVFAIPALVDIILLTTTGHGLYLSAYMAYDDQKYATLALMTSLLLSGAIGTWISIGGTYYLISMAFSAANVFILTRLIGGLAFTAAGALVGFAIISAVVNVRSGAIFLIYLFGLTAYLSVLAVLSTYQVPGSSFLNGRKVLIALLPTLIVAPILSLWVPGYDIYTYPCILYLFVLLMLFGARHVAKQWAIWYHRIKTLNDGDIKEWYIRTHTTDEVQQTHCKGLQVISGTGLTDSVSKKLVKGPTDYMAASHPLPPSSQVSDSKSDLFHGLSEPAILALCRRELYDAVMKENQRRFWQKPTGDHLVKQLAESWDCTLFLLDWYSRLTDTRRPIPFSSTWNLETQVALESMQQSQKGIKLHNSFIHWRNAGDEVGCGVLYFLAALMDRWLDLLYGANLVGLSGDLNSTFRLSVGFGLAYYLVGAVLLDYRAQHLHTLSTQSSPLSIETTAQIRKAKADDQKFRRKLYWNTLVYFLGVHVWALAAATALVWIFNGSSDATIMFLAYVGSYSGLLLYQYNKIFSGPHALRPLFVAVILGFVVGITLKQTHPTFHYDNVIALAVATWTAALLSFRTAKLGLPNTFGIKEYILETMATFTRPTPPNPTKSFGKAEASESQYRIRHSAQSVYRTYCGKGPHQEYSQSELSAFVDKLRSVSKDHRFKVQPSQHPEDSISTHIFSCATETQFRLSYQAFPAMSTLAQEVVHAWQNDLVRLVIVSMQSVAEISVDLQAISEFKDGRLVLFVASEINGSPSGVMDVPADCQAIAELLLHACAENLFGIPNQQAEIVESMLVCRPGREERFSISECSKRSLLLGGSGAQIAAFENECRRTLLRYLCLGYDCEKQWDNLPLEIRQLFLRRCLGARGPYTNTELSWININVPAENTCSILSRIARYDLGAYLAVNKYNYWKSSQTEMSGRKDHLHKIAHIQESHQAILEHSALSVRSTLRRFIWAPVAYSYHTVGSWLKFFVLAAMADTEYQRELKCALGTTPRIVAEPVVFILTGMWIYSRWLMSLSLPFFLYHGREDITNLSNTVKGSLIAQKKTRLEIRNYGENETAFIHKTINGGFKLVFYQGVHKQEPTWGHTRITTYGKDMRVVSREEYKNAMLANKYEYDYRVNRTRRVSKISRIPNTKIPLSRRCVQGDQSRARVQYNSKGHIESGSYFQDGNLVRFKYHYRKNAKYDDELLRAEFVLPHMSVNVNWCAPPVRHAEKMERWIPMTRVHEATFVQGADVYECMWLYDHKFHPTITAKLNGEAVEAPDMIRFDWLGVLKKPTRCNFSDENPLIDFKSATSGFIGRLFRTNIKRQETSTSRARSQLWKAWKKRVDLDGVVTRWVDEQLLRKDALLRPYWRRRDSGKLSKAEDYLAMHADAVMASSDLSSDISAWTPLAIRMSDLFSFGQGGDAVIYTRTKTLGRDTDRSLHVVAVDSGTWPNEGGGVSACRRDLINNLRTIKWHMVVESANDFGLPKHQTEENVESLKIIPLWGLDFLHPSHGMFTNKLDSEVDRLVKEATIKDIQTNFIPTLSALVHGARAITMTQADVKQATRALVNLNTYFQDSRHWKEVWTSDIVKDTWRKLWLADDMPNALPPSEWFRTELPTLGHFDTALELWFRYLFIFSIPIPERIPNVFQASHHSVSASYGIVCKIKRNCTLQIWDHAISWRETNLYLSSAMCTLPPFIRNALLGLMKMTSTLILHHADQILPCADFFNPGWEIEIGSGKGQLTHRNVFRRKVDPIVNGITDMQKFAPVTEIKTKSPTVTMLSHVWFAKDIKTALLAADIISNEWGFKDYKLDIYGALNKAPVYSSECQELIACKGLGRSVALRGTADPAMVLSNTWLFLNSSVSEGLPLALGEAALTGAPVVCTDVGASLRVLTDPDDGKRYSEVVAPNDAYGLARAQINLLAMLDEWAQYAEDDPVKPAPVLPHRPTPKDVEVITRRMYEKTEQRRKLGMKARSIVQKSFGGERYLREHEQMLWVGKARYEMLDADKPAAPPKHPGRMLSLRQRPHLPQRTNTALSVDAQLEKMQHPLAPPKGKHTSAGTSFSSVYLDGPATTSASSSVYGNDWAPVTPDSIGYSAEEGRGYFTQIARPPMAHIRTVATSSTPTGQSSIHDRRPEYEYEDAGGPTSGLSGLKYTPKAPIDPRRNALVRQSVQLGSTRSSLRTRSYLNEVEFAEYDNEQQEYMTDGLSR